MRLAGLLLALLFHGGSPVELSPVDNQGCESDPDFRSEESPPQNAVVAAVAYPFKAAAGLFMPAPQRRQSDGDLSPMTASSRPVSRANTSTTTLPPPAPRMLDDHELPRPPIARNERGLGSTWSES